MCITVKYNFKSTYKCNAEQFDSLLKINQSKDQENYTEKIEN